MRLSMLRGQCEQTGHAQCHPGGHCFRFDPKRYPAHDDNKASGNVSVEYVVAFKGWGKKSVNIIVQVQLFSGLKCSPPPPPLYLMATLSISCGLLPVIIVTIVVSWLTGCLVGQLHVKSSALVRLLKPQKCSAAPARD